MRNLGYIYAISSCLVYGLYLVIEKILLETLNPLFILGSVSMIAGVILIPTLPKASLDKSERPIFLLWFISNSLGEVLVIFGLNLSTAVNGSLLSNLNIVATIVLASLILKEKINRNGKLAILLVIVGAVIASTNLEFFHLTLIEHLFGNVLLSIGFSLFGLTTIMLNILVKKYRILPLLCLIYLMLGIILLTYCWINNLLVYLTIKEFFYLCFMAVIFFDIGLILFYRALDSIGSLRVGAISATIPFLGIFYALIFLGETISTIQILAGCVIAVGVCFLIRYGYDRE